MPTKRANPKGQEQGLTLIECLVAIVVVGLVSSAIAPALVLSVATRVHSQKAEQALALAQSQIDSMRVLVERGEYTVNDLPPLAAGLADKDVATAAGPNLGVTNATNFAYAQPVDIDGNGQADFLVQRYRAVGQSVDGLPVAFAMGVRVYDRGASAVGNLSTQPASLVMTSTSGGRNERPLATLYTTIAASNQGDSLCNLITYVNSGVVSGAKKDLPTICTIGPATP
ncbi:prepilin-type N-terminal cleavage/methylation domain-containing protein [Nodosilinea sp. PGN35]